MERTKAPNDLASDVSTLRTKLIANSVDRARQAAATSNRSMGMVREADHDAVYQ